MFSSSGEIELALQRLGEILAAEGNAYRLVIIGGAALNLLGLIERGTVDVDVLAFGASASAEGIVPPPEPLPTELTRAAARVAFDMSLPADWLNAGPADLWRHGLPEGIETRLTWRRFGSLEVGIVARVDLISFKLYAAVNGGPGGVHTRDLLALQPSPVELSAAAEWVAVQDAGPEFPRLLAEAMAYVERNTR